MRLLNVFSTRVRALHQREAVLGDIDEEMRLHIEMETEANMERGMQPAEARRAAQRNFGNLDRLRETAYEVRGGGFIETFWQDVRYGARVLAKNKGFTAVAVLTLALGIGANTAIFSVVHELLLRPLPYAGAERLGLLWEITPEGRHQNSSSPANYRNWQTQSTTFESMAAFTDRRISLTGGGGEPEELIVQYATPELLRVLRVEPAFGRFFTSEDAVEGAGKVVVLSHGLWKRRFGGDPHMIGKPITLSGAPTTVIGILPPGFQWYIRQSATTGGRPAEVWMPLALPAEGPRTRGRYLSVVARLKPGAAFEQAGAQMRTIAARNEIESPEYNKGFGGEIVPLREQLVGNVRPALLILLGAVALVLLIACANVANLLLSRAAAREKEIALRTAIGARRARVVRQLLTESLLLAVLGSLLGLLFAWWGLKALVAISPADLVNLEGVGLNLPVLAVTLAVSLTTGILFGLVPALEATRLNLNDALKEGGKGTGQSARSQRLRSALVITEIALALVLLAGAGLLVKSFVGLQRVNTGFNPENVLTMVLRLPGAKYKEETQLTAFFNQTMERLRTLPGVRNVGMVNYLPFYGGLGSATDFIVEGRPAPPPGLAPTTDVRVTDGGYFAAMGIPLLRGRSFTGVENREARHVILINDALAQKYFPGENPLGKRIAVNMSDEPFPSEIIGIVADVKHESLVTDAPPTVFMPFPDLPYPFMTLVLRTAGDPADLVPSVRSAIRAIDPEQPIADVRTMRRVMSEFNGRARFNTILLGLFAALATILAAVGIFGVMSYSVTLRTREIGLRMALGAQPGQVLKLILKQGLLLTLIGIAVGLAGALALTRVLSGLLFGVGSNDPVTFATIVVLLTVVSWIACYIPARRATRVDPLLALSAE
ncbi:MAG TPA: ABC transporter permease [Thermoanaerobaculia bacterium]|nr:ABC transporter permease [Thermoanaerobaculia bacterium]